MTKIIYPTDIIKLLKRKMKTGELYKYLQSPSQFRLELKIHLPISNLRQDFSPTHAEIFNEWRKQWKECSFMVKTKPIKIAIFPKPMEAPDKVIVTDIRRCFILIRAKQEMDNYLKNRQTFLTYLPQANEWVNKEYELFTRESMKEKVYSFISLGKEFMKGKREKPLYIREFTAKGVDTKFFEKNIRYLKDLYNILNNTNIEKSEDLYKVLNIINYPEDEDYVTLRLMTDSTLNLHLKNIKVYYKELNSLQVKPEKVVIIENKATFYRFPEIKGCICIWGHGFAVTGFLDNISFIKNAADVYYWSDIDTDGYTMLNNIRKCYPKIKSLMMDERFVKKVIQYNVKDTGSEKSVNSLERLNENEKRAFSYISQNRLRIEQEKIPHELIKEQIKML